MPKAFTRASNNNASFANSSSNNPFNLGTSSSLNPSPVTTSSFNKPTSDATLRDGSVIAPVQPSKSGKPLPSSHATYATHLHPASSKSVPEQKSTQWQHAYNAASALALAVATNALPNPPGVQSTALLPSHPKPYLKVGLGMFAVNQANRLLGWQPPLWGKALEMGAVIHALMLGINRKSAISYLVMTPILLGSVGLHQAAHLGLDKVLSKRPDWNESTRTALELGTKLGVALAGLGLGLKLFPRLYLKAAKAGWMGAQEAKNAIKTLSLIKGTPEAKAYLLSKGDAHHRDAVAISKALFKNAQGALGKQHPWLLGNESSLHQLGQSTASDFQAFEHLRRAFHPDKLLHSNSLSSTEQQLLPDLKRIAAIASHQLEQHQPKPFNKIPFFDLLGTQGAAMSCYNGCCQGSLFCIADVADLFSTLWNNLTHQHHQKDNTKTASLSPQPGGNSG